MPTPDARGRGAWAWEHMDCASAILDDAGAIVAVNALWRRFSKANGGPPDGYLGTNYLASVNTDMDPDLARLRRSIQRILSGEVDQFAFEYPCDAPNERRWYVMRARGDTFEGKRHVTILHTQVATQTLDPDDLMRRPARGDETLREELLRLVGHQFRTPLTPIQFDAQRLAAQASGAEQAIAARIARNADRMAHIVDNSLSLLQLQTRHAIRPQGRLALRSLRQATAAATEALGLADRVTVTATGDDHPMRLDLAWLGRAIQEGLSNAARFTAGPIEVSIHADRDAARVQIHDDGDGAAAITSHFDAFSVNPEHANAVAGAGLGLAILHKVVTGHGGNVRATATRTRPGTDLCIELPARSAQDARSGATKAPTPSRPARPATRPDPPRRTAANRDKANKSVVGRATQP